MSVSYEDFKTPEGQTDHVAYMAALAKKQKAAAELEAAVERSVIRTKLSSPSHWIKSYLADNGAKTIRGQLVIGNMTLIEEKSKCYVAACDARRRYNSLINTEIEKTTDKEKIKALQSERMPTFDNREFDAAVEVIFREARQAAEKEILEKILIKKPSDDLSALTVFVKAVTGRDENKMEVAALAHWMWQVKRKMAGFPVTNHLCPVISGKQNGGKSSALMMLLAPLDHLSIQTGLDSITDERSTPKLQKHYVGLIEEMSGANRADVEVLKDIITSSYRTYRPMRSNETVEIEMKMSLIGTSNNPLETLIYDTTGMRRFIEIKAQDVLDWDTLNSLDALAIWHSIDEAESKGYYHTAAAEIKAHQSDLTAKTPTQLFVDEYELAPGAVEVTLDEMYRVYLSFCEDRRLKQMSQPQFSKQLRAAGFAEPTRKRVNGFRVQVFQLAANPFSRKLAVV